jgi:hypothetical protein
MRADAIFSERELFSRRGPKKKIYEPALPPTEVSKSAKPSDVSISRFIDSQILHSPKGSGYFEYPNVTCANSDSFGAYGLGGNRSEQNYAANSAAAELDGSLDADHVNDKIELRPFDKERWMSSVRRFIASPKHTKLSSADADMRPKTTNNISSLPTLSLHDRCLTLHCFSEFLVSKVGTKNNFRNNVHNVRSDVVSSDMSDDLVFLSELCRECMAEACTNSTSYKDSNNNMSGPHSLRDRVQISVKKNHQALEMRSLIIAASSNLVRIMTSMFPSFSVGKAPGPIYITPEISSTLLSSSNQHGRKIRTGSVIDVLANNVQWVLRRRATSGAEYLLLDSEEIDHGSRLTELFRILHSLRSTRRLIGAVNDQVSGNQVKGNSGALGVGSAKHERDDGGGASYSTEPNTRRNPGYDTQTHCANPSSNASRLLISNPVESVLVEEIQETLDRTLSMTRTSSGNVDFMTETCNSFLELVMAIAVERKELDVVAGTKHTENISTDDINNSSQRNLSLTREDTSIVADNSPYPQRRDLRNSKTILACFQNLAWQFSMLHQLLKLAVNSLDQLTETQRLSLARLVMIASQWGRELEEDMETQLKVIDLQMRRQLKVIQLKRHEEARARHVVDVETTIKASSQDEKADARVSSASSQSNNSEVNNSGGSSHSNSNKSSISQKYSTANGTSIQTDRHSAHFTERHPPSSITPDSHYHRLSQTHHHLILLRKELNYHNTFISRVKEQNLLFLKNRSQMSWHSVTTLKGASKRRFLG